MRTCQWHLTRQIAEDGDETATPSLSIWEFKGDRIIVRDEGPGGALLIKVDESHSPVHVEMVIETDEESGLGLLKVEGDKLLLALGKRQKTPMPESRPEKLQWVSGVYYMELKRVKPSETIVPLKPKNQSQPPQPQEAPSLRASPVIPPQTDIDKSKASAVDRRNARTVVEAYVSAALASDVAKAAALAKNAPADPKRIAEIPKQLNVKRLAIKSVYVHDPAKPVTALATSEAVKLTKKQPDGQRDGFLVLTLTMSDEGWSVTDIDFESEEGAEDELKRFREANPSAVDVPTRGVQHEDE